MSDPLLATTEHKIPLNYILALLKSRRNSRWFLKWPTVFLNHGPELEL